MAGLGFARQDAQLGSTRDTIVGYDDTVAPTLANYETNAANLASDLNNARSMLSYLKDIQAGNWYDTQTAPSTLEAGVLRGVDNLNDALHAVEKKRVLKCVWGLKSITIAAAGNTFDILGTGQLPGNTQARVGITTGLGTVVADHSAAFGAHSLLEVAGPTAISPKNLVQIVDSGTRDPVLDVGDQIYGLLQGETAADFTITDTTTTRVQISFVKVSGNDLVAITAGAMDGVSYDYCYVERVRLEDLNEADFLGGAAVDVPSGSTVTRQVAYDNQGATPVDQTTNAIFDLEGPGLSWSIRDDLEASLWEVVEGSAGGTSQVNIHSGVDEYDNDAAVVNFAQGASIASGKTRPIDVGVNDGIIETTAGALELQAAAALSFDDGNKPVGWSLAGGINLSDAAAEWTTFEANFGEVSLLNAINQAFSGQLRTKVQATVTAASIAADTDTNGPSYAANVSADLAPYDTLTFVDDVEVYLNGELLINDAAAAGSGGVYPGTSAAQGDLKFNGVLRGTGVNPDRLTVIANGQ